MHPGIASSIPNAAPIVPANVTATAACTNFTADLLSAREAAMLRLSKFDLAFFASLPL